MCKQLFSTIKKPSSSLKVRKVPRKSKTAPSPYASSSHLSSALPPPLPPPLPLATRTLLSPLSLHDLNIIHGLTKAPTFSRSPDIMLNFNRKDLKIAMERDRRIVRGASQPNMTYTGLTGSTSERLNVLDLSDIDREGEGVVLSAKSDSVIGCANRSTRATSSSQTQQHYQHQSTSMSGKESKVMNINSNNNIDSGKGRENKNVFDTTKGNNNGKNKGKGRDKGKLKSVRLAALVRDKGAGESRSIRKASYLKRPSQLHFGEIYDGGDEGDRDKDRDRDRDRERGVNKDHHMSHLNGAIPFNRKDYRTAVRSDLASVDRKIRIYNISTDNKRGTSPECLSGSEVSPPPGDSTCCFTPRQSDCRSFHTAQAKLFCWVLAQRRTLLVRAELPDSFPVIGVEAEVSVRDLAAIRGLDVDALLIDPELERIAREIIEEAELTVEDREVARSKSNDVFDGSHLKQRIGQVVSIVVHLSRPGDPSTKHHSTAQAFVDALTQMERAGDGTWTSHSGVHESLGTYCTCSHSVYMLYVYRV